MCVLNSSNFKDHVLMVQGRNHFKSKGKQIAKKPKLEIEDESSKPTDEDSVKKGKKKGSTSKCSYFRKGFHSYNNCFNNNMYIMSQLLDKQKIEVPDELEKSVDSSKHCHNAQFQGYITYSLNEKILCNNKTWM